MSSSADFSAVRYDGHTAAELAQLLDVPRVEVFASVGCSMTEDGPMLGATEFEIHRPIEVGRPYGATGRILGVERKTGRRAGAFDLMRVRVALSDAQGEAAPATTTYVLPAR